MATTPVQRFRLRPARRHAPPIVASTGVAKTCSTNPAMAYFQPGDFVPPRHPARLGLGPDPVDDRPPHHRRISRMPARSVVDGNVIELWSQTTMRHAEFGRRVDVEERRRRRPARRVPRRRSARAKLSTRRIPLLQHSPCGGRRRASPTRWQACARAACRAAPSARRAPARCIRPHSRTGEVERQERHVRRRRQDPTGMRMVLQRPFHAGPGCRPAARAAVPCARAARCMSGGSAITGTLSALKAGDGSLATTTISMTCGRSRSTTCATIGRPAQQAQRFQRARPHASPLAARQDDAHHGTGRARARNVCNAFAAMMALCGDA